MAKDIILLVGQVVVFLAFSAIMVMGIVGLLTLKMCFYILGSMAKQFG